MSHSLRPATSSLCNPLRLVIPSKGSWETVLPSRLNAGPGSTRLEPRRREVERQRRNTMAESLAKFFLDNFTAHRQECAYRQRRGYRMQSFTYGEVMQMALGFARELRSRGISRGDRVMLWSANCAEWVAAFFGCALVGVVVVPMDDGASCDFALRVFRQVQAKLLVGSQRHVQEWLAAGYSTATLTLDDLAATPDDGAEMPSDDSLGRDDVVQIVFTSGTTAEPRGVVITHGNVLANIAPFERTDAAIFEI